MASFFSGGGGFDGVRFWPVSQGRFVEKGNPGHLQGCPADSTRQFFFSTKPAPAKAGKAKPVAAGPGKPNHSFFPKNKIPPLARLSCLVWI